VMAAPLRPRISAAIAHASLGSYLPPDDRWGTFEELAADVPEGALVVMDRRVARLHPSLARALKARKPRAVVLLEGAEGSKSLAAVERIALAGRGLPRSGTLVAVGGGTIGDVCTVAAHLIKRGVTLMQVPTTVLAAVDSSLGGKGALNLGQDREVGVKNALGVFHYARRTWLCPEVLTTLEPAQVREGFTEAWKMAACLDAGTWAAWSSSPPALEQLIREARALKARVCAEDPYELRGTRQVLNFGHTFGHVIESLTRFRVAHGDAVGLGMLCALDVGRAAGVTPEDVARQVETQLHRAPGILPRSRLAKVLAGHKPSDVEELLREDKKTGASGELRMVLLRRVGQWVLQQIQGSVWRKLIPAWKEGWIP
jgi:3-dehydroquinate synthase